MRLLQRATAQIQLLQPHPRRMCMQPALDNTRTTKWPATGVTAVTTLVPHGWQPLARSHGCTDAPCMQVMNAGRHVVVAMTGAKKSGAARVALQERQAPGQMPGQVGAMATFTSMLHAMHGHWSWYPSSQPWARHLPLHMAMHAP